LRAPSEILSLAFDSFLHDADVNAKDNEGKTPLYFAELTRHKAIANLLRKHGGKTGEELKAEGK